MYLGDYRAVFVIINSDCAGAPDRGEVPYESASSWMQWAILDWQLSIATAQYNVSPGRWGSLLFFETRLAVVLRNPGAPAELSCWITVARQLPQALTGPAVASSRSAETFEAGVTQKNRNTSTLFQILYFNVVISLIMVYINAKMHIPIHRKLYIQICMHTCIPTYTHTYTHTYIHTYIHKYIHTRGITRDGTSICAGFQIKQKRIPRPESPPSTSSKLIICSACRHTLSAPVYTSMRHFIMQVEDGSRRRSCGGWCTYP